MNRRSLQTERDYYRQQAAAHSRAADDANRLAGQLSDSINVANAKIAAVNDYLSRFVDRLDSADTDLTNALSRVASSVGAGLNESASDFGVKDLNSGNSALLANVRGNCDAIIDRLNRDIASLQSQLSAAQQRASEESVTSYNFSVSENQAQHDLDAAELT
ncbi:hypothetical protein OZX74_06730 [Bifidobacterium sp. ESL0798]|uniref:hypothetical protein n=1 Tax=Bifidobacterium sp. ESL0798 TaxID=2983235 RepID=UPI0023F71515|nr:hypothetical protein [Bifidobacterium sp. ESL0798]WEV73606.1 hypothetical protein OZX74_06730 [Bifidobacterium sp. ESL0798]